MGRKSVAVLDVRSSEITAIIGERGVNNTFVVGASHTEPYFGYQEGAFYDTENLKEAILKCVSSVEKTMNRRLTKLYIGVPGEFTSVVPREQVAGYSAKRKISERETEALSEGGKLPLEGYRPIVATSMIYVTADNRRVVRPHGLTTTSLRGLFSYFYCNNYFAETMESIFQERKIALKYLPTEFAVASYLIPAETRDEYCLFLDSGYLSSTVCVVLGGGVLAQKSYWVGKGQIAARVMQAFELSYDAACALLKKANLYVKDGGEKQEFLFEGEIYEIDPARLADVVKEGLDELCEQIAGFLDECTGRELEFKPLYVTGEGIAEIRGALEHVTKRISRMCEPLAPDLPYYNKPAMSSRIALIDMAYEDNLTSGGFFRRLFNTFGG